MNNSIINDAVLSACKTMESFDVPVSTPDLGTSREVLVKSSAAVLLVAALNTRYAKSVVAAGFLVAGVNYINHRFELSRRIKNVLNKREVGLK